MKKFISCILMVAIFLSLFTMVTFAESDPPNLVADYRFNVDTQGWYVFNGTSGLTHQDGYISASNEGKSWVSPAVDIYDIIKEAGTGTYTVNARIYIAFDPGHEVNARMMLRTNKEYSFSTNHSGNYYGDIGTLTYCEPFTWINMSGSFKVLASDIQNSSGDFILCFDSLFALETYNVYVDDVKICKLSEDDITNGDFSYDEIGWRNWGGKGNFTVEGEYHEILGPIFTAYYLKASPYGSIVTNVDQIIAKYGCTKYKLSFQIKVEEDYLENLEKIGFLFARNKGDYNYWLGMADATTLEDSNWVTFEKTVDMATIVEDGQTLYDVLAPYQNQVFLRYHYFDAEGVSYDEEHSYYVTDVSFKPVPQIDSIQLNETNKTVHEGWEGTIDYTVWGNLAAVDGVIWSVVDSNIVDIDSETGDIVAKNVGTTNIIAASRENANVFAICKITVTEYKQAVILLHGRTDNTANVFGAVNEINSGNNGHFDSDVEAVSLNNKIYTSVSAQQIKSVITYAANDENEQEVNLAYELVNEKGYTPNKNLFAFNYPNEDAVIHSAIKFKVYIDNLINYVRSSDDQELKDAFYVTDFDYVTNNYRFSIVAHSMGGLVARYYIENCTVLTHYETGEHNTTCKYGDLHVSKLITICTPHWGSGYGDLSSTIGSDIHVICDHDLDLDSAMFDGNSLTNLNCKAVFSHCYNGSYTLTDALLYEKTRNTKYYAIAGIDYPVGISNKNDTAIEMPNNFTTVQQIADYFAEKGICSFSSTDMSIIKINPKGVGDNMVGFLSQIGWVGDNPNTTPAPRIQMEKIFVDVDSNGGNGGGIFVAEILPDGSNIFHSKVPHRQVVCNKVAECLEE